MVLNCNVCQINFFYAKRLKLRFQNKKLLFLAHYLNFFLLFLDVHEFFRQGLCSLKKARKKYKSTGKKPENTSTSDVKSRFLKRLRRYCATFSNFCIIFHKNILKFKRELYVSLCFFCGNCINLSFLSFPKEKRGIKSSRLR